MTTTNWTTATQLIGINGHPAAGILGDTPELVNYDRSRGYPFPPFATMPERWIPGASSIGKAIGTDWSWWARRVAAQVGARLRKELADITDAKTAEQRLYKEADDEQWKPAHDGSTVHLYTAIEDAQRPQTIELESRLEGHVNAWRAFKERHSVRIGAIERTGYAPDFGHGSAGTIDRLAAYTTDNTERLAVIDLKTKRQPLSKLKPSLEHLVQIVALAHSTHLAIEEAHILLDLPPIHRGIIVYLARDGYRAHFVDPRKTELVEITKACIAAAALKPRIGNGAFGTPDVHPLNVHAPKLVDPPTRKDQQ